jgi:hypothetical protein
MNCPSAEVLSRWIDGLVPSDKIPAHLRDCAACAAKVTELRAAGDWIKTADAGSNCLTPEQVALIIEGRLDSDHVRTCPSCAAEVRDLTPKKRATTRIFRPKPAAAPWIAVAAALLIAALVTLFVWSQKPDPAVAKNPPKKEPPKHERIPDLPRPEPTPQPVPEPERDPRIGPDAPEPVDRPGTVGPPQGKPVVPDPQPEPKPEPPKPKPTVEEPAPAEVAVAVKSGALSAFENGKWVKAARIIEGLSLRADGRTRLEFAGARVTLEAAAKFSLAKSDLSLASGQLTADVPPGSTFALTLGTSSIVPQTSTSRVLLVARDNQVVVEEGSAKSGDLILGEDEQFETKDGKLTARKARTIPAAARARELLTWKLDILNPNATRGRLDTGKVVTAPTGRKALQSTPNEDRTYHEASIRYFAGGDAVTFTVKPTTSLRFRYFAETAAPVLFTIRNKTKDENFSLSFTPVAGRWTTMTIPIQDVPVNTGGRKVACETGDAYGRFGWSVGKPGENVDFMIDQFEILEIEK